MQSDRTLPHDVTKVDAGDDVHSLTRRLIQNTVFLRTIGRTIAAITFLNILLALMPIVFMALTRALRQIFFNLIFIPSGIVATLGVTFIIVMSLVLYDSRRRASDVIFEELSDELQWYVIKNTNPSINVTYEDSKSGHLRRPSINVRVALREYVRTTDMPLIPGRMGPFLYIITNILLSFVAVFFWTQFLALLTTVGS
jgi:hypothetical protein